MSFNQFIATSSFSRTYLNPGSGLGCHQDVLQRDPRSLDGLVEGRADRSNDPRCACGTYLSRYGNSITCAVCESRLRQKRMEAAS